jgi:predicted metal-dependent HD superfamily phosphohydrolase
MMDLKERFQHICFQYSQDQNLIDNLWSEIEKKYSEKKRHYHDLEHLENMFSELDPLKDKISNFTHISFSVFYHDVIYDASSRINEEKSAEFAKLKLQKLNLNSDCIEKISEQIIATKAHQQSIDRDTNYLLDADLSILGKDLETYIDYTKKIRKEYSIYPDLLYKPGRKNVLKHFLALENIFKTEDFREKYEVRARENIRFEIDLL